MFKFFKEFRIVTTWSYINEEHMHETKTERQKQFDEICKQFGIGWSQGKLRLSPIPEKMLKQENVVMFARGKTVTVEWRCIATPEKWEKFCEGINDYVKDKDFADYNVYDSPR